MDAILVLALGGILGAALRVVVTPEQPTFSRRTIADVVLGGVVGLLYPLYPVVQFPADATLLQRAAIVGLVAYFSGDLAAGLAARVKALATPR